MRRCLGVEIADGVYRIGPRDHGMRKGGYSQAYLFDDGHALTLVDTGWDDDGHSILNYLWKLGRTPDELAHIAITHAHRSHLGGLATLKRLAPNVDRPRARLGGRDHQRRARGAAGVAAGPCSRSS